MQGKKNCKKRIYAFLLMHAQELHDFVSVPQNGSEWYNTGSCIELGYHLYDAF